MYDKILNNDFKSLQLTDFNKIYVSCMVKNVVSFEHNKKRYFYKIVLDDLKFNYDLDKKYNLIDLFEVIKNDILTSLPF